jgi:peptidoglycan hydrolase CwlO-like protein
MKRFTATLVLILLVTALASFAEDPKPKPAAPPVVSAEQKLSIRNVQIELSNIQVQLSSLEAQYNKLLADQGQKQGELNAAVGKVLNELKLKPEDWRFDKNLNLEEQPKPKPAK